MPSLYALHTLFKEYSQQDDIFFLLFSNLLRMIEEYLEGGLSDEEVEGLLASLEQNDLESFLSILSGYESVDELVFELREDVVLLTGEDDE